MSIKQRFVVVVSHPRMPGSNMKFVGPYTSFKRAEVDAKAWDKTAGRECWVEPMIDPNGQPIGETEGMLE